ncbi:MAG: DUF2162 domain-containing protein [Deltaproteobacteria bacterium]|jgi:predicted transporter|nr:DUF2162 domain-containing protein [Deltaproteobacteria bacterium]
MELQSLIMGLLVAVMAFAVKTGLGWAYLWQRRGPGGRLWPTLTVLALYAALFGLVLFLVNKIDILSNYQVIEPLWRGGQTIHWLIAILMFAWGLILTRHTGPEPGLGEPSPGLPSEDGLSCHAPKEGKGSYGFLALIIPCPVCLSVVTMSLACLVIYFPDQALLGTAILYCGFVVVAAVAGICLINGLLGQGESLERSLGLAMVTIASYFIVSALVLPQFGQIDRVYRLASYAEESEKNLPVSGLWLLAVISALALFGFLMARRKGSRL